MRVRLLFYTLLAILLAIGVIILYIALPYLTASLAEQNVIAGTEPLTELYFDDASTLPQSLRPLSFSFTLHNLEGKDMTYPYVVRAEYPDGRAVILDRNAIPIAANEAARIPERFQVPVQIGMRVIVELPEQGQYIAFRIK